MTKFLTTLLVCNFFFIANAKIHVDLAKECKVDVVAKKASYADSTEVNVNQVEKIEYAKYVSIVVDAIKTADSAKMTQVLNDMIDKIGQGETIKVMIGCIGKIEKCQDILFFIDVIEKIELQNANSQQIYEIMEAIAQKAIEIGICSYRSENVKNQNAIDLKWYDYYSEGGTGMWAVMKKAKYKSEKGEDISGLYRIFLKMINDDANSVKFNNKKEIQK